MEKGFLAHQELYCLFRPSVSKKKGKGTLIIYMYSPNSIGRITWHGTYLISIKAGEILLMEQCNLLLFTAHQVQTNLVEPMTKMSGKLLSFT